MKEYQIKSELNVFKWFDYNKLQSNRTISYILLPYPINYMENIFLQWDFIPTQFFSEFGRKSLVYRMRHVILLTLVHLFYNSFSNSPLHIYIYIGPKIFFSRFKK
jgi:hypothetical protein